VLPAGANDVPFEVAEFDDVSGWSGGSGYMCDRPGLWILQASIHRAAVAAAAQAVVRVRRNGLTQQQVTSVSTTNLLQLQVSTLLEAEAGDVFSVNATLSGTASATLVAGHTALNIVRVGPKAWT
jgi:hypothetical protein